MEMQLDTKHITSLLATGYLPTIVSEFQSYGIVIL